MNRTTRFITGAVLAAALSLPVVAQQSTTGSAYDQQIQAKAADVLRGNDRFKNIQAQTDDSIVTLTGTVERYTDKLSAEKKLRKQEHVAGVRNDIVVKGKDVPDAELRDQLAKKLRYDRVDLGNVFNNLTLSVNDGVATVGGNVRTPADKASALSAVQSAPGVKGVVDQISVAPVSGFDDRIRLQVARAIYGRLPQYAIDPQAPIRIVVNNGNVALFGAVNSSVDRQVAEMQARSVPGVFSVTDNVEVPGAVNR